MDYKEYRKASIRHLSTCRHLLKDIKNEKPEKKGHLLLNIYYLSGYVIETALSYAFFSHISHTGHVEDCIHYTGGFKTHKFDVKIKFISQFKGDLSSIPFVYNKLTDNRLNKLFSHWSTDFRYSYSEKIKDKDISEEIIVKYLTNVESLLTIILKRF